MALASAYQCQVWRKTHPGNKEEADQAGHCLPPSMGTSTYLLTFPTIKSPSECNGSCFTPASQISCKLLFWSALAQSNRRKGIRGGVSPYSIRSTIEHTSTVSVEDFTTTTWAMTTLAGTFPKAFDSILWEKKSVDFHPKDKRGGKAVG